MVILLTFATTFALARHLSQSASCLHILDHPNDRSLHLRPIPRAGGLAILLGGLAGNVLFGLSSPATCLRPIILLLGLVPLAGISFLDDRCGVPIKWRVLTHFWVASSIFLAISMPAAFDLPGLALALPVWIAIPLTLLFVI
ncbi:MAG: hypothetical protein V9G98_26130, partial [Candidatus Competibacter sp.]